MTVDFTALLPLYIYVSSVLLAAIVAAVRLEGRVNTEAQKQVDLKELINTKLESIDRRLGRIEQAMNGALRKD